MTRYAISQEGADAMRKLSSDLRASVAEIESTTRKLKSSISVNMDELGTYGIDIWALVLQIDNLLEDKQDIIMELADRADQKSDEILELMGTDSLSGSTGSGNTGSNAQSYSVNSIAGWIKDINPNYNNPFYPTNNNPYRVNCGSCAYSVELRLQGNTDAVATSTNIGTDAAMEKITGKSCEYMSPDDIKQILISMGPGSHLICGVNRYPTPDGRAQAGHWFNAYYDGNKVYTIDGQSGQVFDEWPHDYVDVSEWCALV